MDIQDWVLDSFKNIKTAGLSQLEQQLLELITNKEIKIKLAITNFGCKSQSRNCTQKYGRLFNDF